MFDFTQAFDGSRPSCRPTGVIIHGRQLK